jgi:uncharacterized membrane protein
MERKSSRSLWQSMALGLVAGLRSASAGAIASYITKKAKRNGTDNNRFIRFMHSDGFNTTLNVMAVGELIVDKLPFVPARTMPVGLVARIISGGISSAAVSETNGRGVILYALLGSAVAAGATYTFYHLRRIAGNKTGIADPLIAIVEDAIVAGVGLALIKTSQESE